MFADEEPRSETEGFGSDLQLIATGSKHCEVFEYAFNKTHIHMDDMGALSATKKCMTFSTDSNVQNWLRT